MSTASQLAESYVRNVLAKRVNLTVGERERIERELSAIFAPHMPTSQTSFEFGANVGQQRNAVLSALKQAKSHGCTNTELNKLCFRYGARIYELRAQGYRIETAQIGVGLYRYTLAPESW